jgi:glycosyltransferase involved in cell wall biosynthesis
MKIPIVAYRCGGTREALIPNASGFLIERGDVAALADRLKVLLEDQSLRFKMGERGREYVSRQFGTLALIHRHEAFYLEALGEHGHRVPHKISAHQA